MDNILLIRLKAIGDVIFTLPAVSALREHFPAAKITFLTSKENATLLRGFPQVSEVIALDRAALRSGQLWKMGAEFFGLLRRLRAGRFSLVVDFQGFGETAWLARITGAPQRWGSVYGAGRRWAYTRGLVREDNLHPAEWNLQMLNRCGVASHSIRNEFSLPADALAGAQQFFDGTSTTDTITGNTFRMPTAYHMYNNSVNAKYAPGNLFEPSDSALISKKIYDQGVNASKGAITWQPALPGPPVNIQSNPPCDMAEPPALWYGYPETGYPATVKIPDTVYLDSTQKVTGAASVKLVTSRGWDLSLNYRPAGDSLPEWHLTNNDTLWFWVRTIKQPQYGFQYFSIRIGDDHGDYYKYTAASSLLNAANLAWKQYRFPLAGNTQFARSMVGTMSLDQANYVEFHADTWDYGFTLWVDGVQFHPCSPVVAVEPDPGKEINMLMNYPNPFSETTTIMYSLAKPGPVKLDVYNSRGIMVSTIVDHWMDAGDHETGWKGKGGAKNGPGIYLLKLTTATEIITRKIVWIK